jgi:RimJ/RimL family protein N-acetyltransferase
MQPEYPKRVKLKNGQAVTLRPLESSDEDDLIRFFVSLPRECTQFLKHNVREPQVVRRFVREADSDTVWCILALADDGRVMGDATLHMHRMGWGRHVGEVRVVVDPTLHKQRLAISLIHELLNHASARGLRRLKAEILDSQTGARIALERMGFREEARLKNHALDYEDRVHDLLLLTTTVEDLWGRMEDLITDLDMARDLS